MNRHLTGIVHGENVNLPYWTPSDPMPARMAAQCMERCGRSPAKDIYTRGILTSPPSFSAALLAWSSGISGPKSSQAFGLWPLGICGGFPEAPYPTPRAMRGLRSAPPMRSVLAICSSNKAHGGPALVPREYVELLSRPSPFNPHSPFSLTRGKRRWPRSRCSTRRFFQIGCGRFWPVHDSVAGHGDLQDASLNAETYDPAVTGLPLTYSPDTSRDDWKPHPFNSLSMVPLKGIQRSGERWK